MTKLIKYLLTFIFVISLISCLFREKSKSDYNYKVSLERILRDENLNELANSTLEFDSCLFFDIGTYWSRKDGLFGIGFLDDKKYRLEIIFKLNLYSEENYWGIGVKNIKRKLIKDVESLNYIIKTDFDLLFNLNNDSLKIVQRDKKGIYQTPSSHQSYAISIKTIKDKSKLIYLYNPDYYINLSPSKQRIFFIKTIEDVEKLLK